MHRHRPPASLDIPWDQVEDYDALARHPKENSAVVGAINANLFQDDEPALESLTTSLHSRHRPGLSDLGDGNPRSARQLSAGTQPIGVRHCAMRWRCRGHGSTDPASDSSAHDPVTLITCCAVPRAAKGMHVAPSSKTLVTSLRRDGEIDRPDRA